MYLSASYESETLSTLDREIGKEIKIEIYIQTVKMKER